MKSFISLLQRFAWPFGLFAGAYAVALPFVPDFNIDKKLFLAFLAIALSMLVTAGIYVSEKPSNEHEELIIEQIRENGRLFLIRKNNRLGQSMGARVFLADGDFELYLGQGEVINVQANGMVQLVFRPDGIDEPTLRSLSENRPDIRRKILVRPGVIMKALNEEEIDEKSI